MNVLERRVRMATAILNDLNDKDFSEMERLFKSLKKRQLSEPCVYSLAELKESLLDTEREFAEGKGIPHKKVIETYGI